jgi:hypothetical protein
LADPSPVFFNHPYGGDMQLQGQVSRAGQTYSYRPRRRDETQHLATNLRNNRLHESFLQGFRELGTDVLAQLGERIATEVRTETRALGRPFLTLTDFLNAGVLQKAIDAVPAINRFTGPPSGRIPHLSPAHVSAGTLLNHLAPVLFARSDTFIIRSMGHTDNPVGQQLSRAYLETTVQRTPSDTVVVMGSSAPRFRVIRQQWVEVLP